MRFIDQQIVEDDELRSLRRPSPDSDAVMGGTGRMQYDAAMDQWFVEFRCPEYGELYFVYAPEHDATCRRVAERHGRC